MRHKDVEWSCHEKVTSWEEVNAAILMDIRDELKKLNGLLYCENFVGIPSTLRAIKTNTTKRKRKPGK